MRHPAGHQEIPQLFQAALLPPHRLLGRPGFLDRKRDVRPVERREAQPRLLAVRDRESAQGAAVEGAFERDDEATVTVLRCHDAIEEHRLDRILDRLGARVDDEVARRPGGRDPVQLRLEAQGQDSLVLRMCITRRHEW